jgi:hypothetical protein
MTITVELTDKEADSVLCAIRTYRDDYDFQAGYMRQAQQKVLIAIHQQQGEPTS